MRYIMEIDIVNEHGSGHLYLRDKRNARGEQLMYLIGRDGKRFYAELAEEDQETPGVLDGLRARSLPELARRIARHYDITGGVHVENEVTGARKEFLIA